LTLSRIYGLVKTGSHPFKSTGELVGDLWSRRIITAIDESDKPLLTVKGVMELETHLQECDSIRKLDDPANLWGS
jgi:hypothetical protein